MLRKYINISNNYFINRFVGKKAVKVCALTGVAARLVGGTTLHSTFKLPVQKDGTIRQMQPLTGNYLKILRQEWKNIEWLFNIEWKFRWSPTKYFA